MEDSHSRSEGAAYWWTHTTLEEEAAPPDATAAEAAAAALAAVTHAVRERLAALPSLPSDAAAARGSVEARAAFYDSLHLADTLPALLVQVRKAMERAWWEQRQQEDDMSAAGRAALPSGTARAGEPRSPRAGPQEVIDPAARARLVALQHQIYTRFFGAVAQGAAAAAAAAHESACATDGVTVAPRDERATREAPHAWRLSACVDGLLAAMCVEAPARGVPCASKAVWAGGCLQTLRRRTGAATTAAAAAPDEGAASPPEDEEQSLLMECAAAYLHDELHLSLLDRAADCPQLTAAARDALRAALKAVTTCASGLAPDAAGSPDDRAHAVAALISFLQHVAAPLLAAVGDGLLLRPYTSAEHSGAHAARQSSPGGPLPSPVWAYRVASLTAVTRTEDARWLVDDTTALLTACAASCRCAEAVCGCASDAAEPGEEPRSPPAAHWAALHTSLKSAYGEHLKRSSLRLFVVLGQYADTAPWMLTALQLMARSFYSASPVLLAADADERVVYGRLAEDIGAIAQQSGLSGDTVLAADTERARRRHFSVDALPWDSLAGVCEARLSVVLGHLLESSPEELFSALSSEHEKTSSAAVRDLVFPLSFLLIYEPLVVLPRLLQMGTNAALVQRSCAVDSCVTEKGGGSLRRAKAYRELPPGEASATDPHEVALLHFPRLYPLFCAVEVSLRWAASHADGAVALSSDDTRAREVAHYFGACLARGLHRYVRDAATAVVAGELLMFISFALRQVPLYPAGELALVRDGFRCALGLPTAHPHDCGDADAAVIRFIAGKVMPVKDDLPEADGADSYWGGILSFLLPPLRAIGLDHGTALDNPNVSVAIRYPASASVAFLTELPRGYYARASPCVAKSQHDDALDFFDRVLFGPLQADDAAGRESAETLLELLGEVGCRVLCRIDACLHGSSSSSSGPAGSAPVPTPAGGLLQPVVADVLADVYFSVLRLCRDVTRWDASLRHTVLQRIVLRTAERLRAACPASADAHGYEQRTAPLLVLPARFLCGAAGRAAVDAREALAAVDVQAHTEWETWFWAAEYEALDDEPATDFKAALRACNISYTRQLSTQALRSARAVVEEHLNSCQTGRAAMLEAMDGAIAADLARTQQSVHRGQPNEEGAKSQSTAASAHGTTTEPAASGPSVPAAAAAAAAVPLTLANVQRYVDRVLAALLLRARTSPAEAALCGVALRCFLAACRRHGVEAAALISVVRQLLARLRTAMSVARPLVCSRGEATALSRLLHEVTEGLVLPYKMSFAPPPGLSAAAAALVKEAATTFAADAESEAVHTLAVALEDTAGLVRLHLARVTLLADWSAYAVVSQCRCALRLVQPIDSIVVKAIATRRDMLSRSAIVSPGFQALTAVERPLPEGMTAPARSVQQLYTKVPMPSTAAAPSSLRPQRGGQERGSAAPQRRERRKESPALEHGSRHHRHDSSADGDRGRSGAHTRRRSGSRDRDRDRDVQRRYERRDDPREGRRRDGDASAARGRSPEHRSSAEDRHRVNRPRGGRRAQAEKRSRH